MSLDSIVGLMNFENDATGPGDLFAYPLKSRPVWDQSNLVTANMGNRFPNALGDIKSSMPQLRENILECFFKPIIS